MSNTGVVSATNSTATPLSGGATFTGGWEVVSQYGSITVAGIADQAATLYADFSTDGVSVDVANQLSDGTTGSLGFHGLIPVRQYMRVRVVNGATPQTSLRLQTIYNTGARISFPTARLDQALGPYSPVLNTRSALFGTFENGQTTSAVGVTPDRALLTETGGPLSAFGEVLTTTPEPRVQVDAIYGIQTTDVEVITGTNGAGTASGGMFSCATSADVGSYAVIRSRRTVKYRPGQGLRCRFTSLYTAGVSLSLQMAGLLTSTDGLMVGYSGATFGFLRRVAGAAAIHRLTVTVGSGGAETVTVTLNGTAFAFASGGALSTTALAQLIAAQGSLYTGWYSIVSPQSVGATVTFLQGAPAATAGAFTLTSTGTAAGTFATIQTGAANDDAAGFVAQTAWNIDRLDGSGGLLNPSGETLDPTKLSVWEIVVPYLGAGPILLRWLSPNGRFIPCHRVEYPNSAIIPSQRNPTYRVAWLSASLGSTTALTVKGASGAAFVEGPTVTVRNPETASASVTATTTESVALALRVRGEFGATVNQRTIIPHTLFTALETSNRVVSVKVYVNPTLSASVDWARVDASTSSVDSVTPSGITATGGEQVAAYVVATGSGIELELHELDLRLSPGDVLVVTVDAASSTAVTSLALNWHEV